MTIEEDVRSELAKIMVALAAPFDPSQIHWRPGSTTKDKTRCMALAYVDARDVMNRLDEVAGPEAWTDRMERVGDAYICHIGLWLPTNDQAVDFHWVFKSDSAGETQIESAKGGASDAFKRAAVKWGIGRYLYALDSPWVDYDAQRRKISDEGMFQLFKSLGGKAKARTSKPTKQAPSGGTGSVKKIDANGKKQLFRANYKALEAVGYSKDQINEMDNKQKFRPLNQAEGKIGAHRTDDLYEHQIEETLEVMRQWVRTARTVLEDRDELPDNPSDLEGTF